MTRLSSKERKKEILNVVLKIIHEDGYYNLTIRNISKNINISEAAIYRHFKNKKEIIEKLTDLIVNNPFWNEINVINEDLYSLLQEIMRKQFKFLQDNPYLTSIVFQEEIFREYSDIGNKIKDCKKEKEKMIIKIIKIGQQKNIFNDKVNPSKFALLYMGAIRMSIINWRESNFSYSLNNEAHEITEELFKLLK